MIINLETLNFNLFTDLNLKAINSTKNISLKQGTFINLSFYRGDSLEQTPIFELHIDVIRSGMIFGPKMHLKEVIT